MNSFERDDFWLLRLTVQMRLHLYDVLTDDDLAYRLPGSNLTLGELCREVIEVQQDYLESFKTQKLEFKPNSAPAELATSLAAIKARTDVLDALVEQALANLKDDEIAGMIIERAGGWKIPIKLNYQFYREALLIFFAKVSLYLKALNKPLNHQWIDWMG